MTRVTWLRALAMKGVRVHLRGSHLCVRGRLSARDRARLDRDRAGVVRLLRARRRRQAEKVEQQQNVSERRVIGERLLSAGGVGRERVVTPIYADELERIPALDKGSIIANRLALIEAIRGSHVSHRQLGRWYLSYEGGF